MDLRQKVFGDRGPLKRLMGSIPGYDGYQRKEMRRDADKLLRNHLAAKLGEEQRRLNEQKLQLVNSGQLLAIGPLDRATTKLQLLVDRIKTATYGYAGWFDAVTVQESDLDALYDFDNSLNEGLPQLAGAIDKLATAIAGKGNVAGAANDLIGVVDDLNARFGRRQELLVEGKRPPAPALDVLAARETPTPQGLALLSLRLNDAVSYEGVDYLVNGRLAFANQDESWVVYQLKDSQAERWLWVGDAGRTVGVLESFSPPADVTSAPAVQLEGEEFKLARAGSAEVTVEGPSGRRSGVLVEFRSYTSPADRLLWVEKWAEGPRTYLGRRVDPDELKVWKR